MRRLVLWIPLVALAGCHAHTTAAQSGKESAQNLEKPPESKQVSSERPVRTTPGGMLDDKSVKELQSALDKRGFKTSDSGELDKDTEEALRRFQKSEHVAQTGLPDFDTVRRLGLDPKKLYLGGTERRDEAKK
jgi:peptidoglycan hydrolase-like protein with peptidoglycan-binding domain